jgi:hypothetical protein
MDAILGLIALFFVAFLAFTYTCTPGYLQPALAIL